jgi:hypothetical protein
MKPTFEKGEEGENGNIMEEVNVFKVHCTYRIITMKSPRFIDVY